MRTEESTDQSKPDTKKRKANHVHIGQQTTPAWGQENTIQASAIVTTERTPHQRETLGWIDGRNGRDLFLFSTMEWYCKSGIGFKWDGVTSFAAGAALLDDANGGLWMAEGLFDAQTRFAFSPSGERIKASIQLEALLILSICAAFLTGQRFQITYL